MSALTFDYVVPGDDFTQAGAASSDVKRKLKQIGCNADVIRRVAIAMYEGEINMVIHAHGGEARVEVDPQEIRITLSDRGPGIPDVEKAMEPLFTTGNPEERSGLGFAVMQSFMDKVKVISKPGKGTKVLLIKRLAQRE